MKTRLLVLLAFVCLTFSCSRKSDTSAAYAVFADQFAHALADGRFVEAHALLAEEAQNALPAAQLKKQYEEMIAYGPGPGTHVEVMQTLDAWPDKQKGDLGWVYVAIAGDNFSEAVTVVVTRTGPRLAIRTVEFGRP